MTTSEVLDRWYQEDPPLLNRQPILDFFQVSDTTQLVHICTEDDDVDADAHEWLAYLIELSMLELPHLSGAFELQAGGISNSEEYVMFVAGNGNFDSSFPILIYRKKDEKKMSLLYLGWKASIS